MPFDGQVTELPCGRAGMVNHENRLLSDPLQLLTAEGVSYEDDHVQRERGAAAYDTAGLSTPIQYTATLSTAQDWDAYLFSFVPNGGTPAWTRSVGTASANTTGPSAAPLIVVPGVATPVGATLWLTVACSNFFSGMAVSVADTAGNTWVPVSTSTSTPIWDATFFFRCDVTTLMPAGTIVSVAITGLTPDPLGMTAAVTLDEFANLGAADLSLFPSINPSLGRGTTTAVSTRVTSTPLVALPELLYGIVVSYNEPATTVTPAGGFTARSDISPTTGVNDVRIATATRVDATLPIIVGQYDWISDAVTTPAGTITTTAGSQAITGVGTTFTDHAPGDQIIVAGESHLIETITNNTSLTTVTYWRNTNAGVAYRRRVGSRLVTVTSEGAIFKEKPTTLTTGNLDETTLSTSLSKTPGPTAFVSGGKEAAANNRKLFIYSGVDRIQVLSGDGTSTTAITTLPAGTDWAAGTDPVAQPLAGTIHQSRHVAWGNLTDPHRLYFSDPDDHENFNNAGVTFSVRMRSDVGDRIYSGVSFNGVLFVWKYPRGIFWLDDSDVDTTNWVIRTKSTALGCAPSPYAALAMDDDVLFMAANGSFHLLSAVDALGGTKASDVTHALGLDKWLRENLNLARLDRAVSVWNQHRKTAVFYVPGAGETTNTVALKFDFGLVASGGPIRFHYSYRDAAAAVTIRRPISGGGPEVPIIGDQTSAYLLDQSTWQKAGVDYPTIIQTPHLDCSWVHPSYRYLRKIFRELELVMEPSEAGGTVTVDVYVDAVLRQTLTYDPTMRRQKKHLTVGDGHTISVRVTKSDSTNMKLLSMILYFHPGNEDQSR